VEAKEVINKLVTIYREKKLAHAYLIETNNVTQCYSDILMLIKIINCPYEFKEQCDRCNLCHLLDEDNLPSFIHIEPDGKNIKKEAIENLKKVFNMVPIYTANNIYVIKYPEKMNDTAYNKMLKFLEEPEQNIIGFFITENKDYVANTIVSRCEFIKMNYKTGTTPARLGLNDEEYERYSKMVNNYIYVLENNYNSIIWYNSNVLEKELGDRTDLIKFLKVLFTCYMKCLSVDINKNKRVCAIIEKYLEQLNYNVNTNLLLNSLALDLGEVYGK